VNPAIVAAAARVRDGDIVPDVVPEGDRFAVVWRRGTLAAIHRRPGDPGVNDAIRVAIADERANERTDALVAGLRKAKVSDEDAGPLDSIEAPTDPVRDAAARD
jgi:peptidyl-prolyl cis-trans isomerase C